VRPSLETILPNLPPQLAEMLQSGEVRMDNEFYATLLVLRANAVDLIAAIREAREVIKELREVSEHLRNASRTAGQVAADAITARGPEWEAALTSQTEQLRAAMLERDRLFAEREAAQLDKVARQLVSRIEEIAAAKPAQSPVIPSPEQPSAPAATPPVDQQPAPKYKPGFASGLLAGGLLVAAIVAILLR
jgi:hypothetical protein